MLWNISGLFKIIFWFILLLIFTIFLTLDLLDQSNCPFERSSAKFTFGEPNVGLSFFYLPLNTLSHVSLRLLVSFLHILNMIVMKRWSRQFINSLESRRFSNMPPKRIVNIFLTFDCFGTLYTPYPSVDVQYSSFVHQHTGILVPPEVVAKNMRPAFKAMYKMSPNYGKPKTYFDTAANSNIPFYCSSLQQQSQDLEQVKTWWMDFIRLTFRELVDSSTLTDNVIEGLYHKFGTKEAYITYPDVVPALDRLTKLQKQLDRAQTSGDKEIRLNFGVVTNSDPRVFNVLESLGLLKGDNGPFEPNNVFISYDAEYSKPDLRIFEYAEQTIKQRFGQGQEFHFLNIGDEQQNDQVAASQLDNWSGILVDRSQNQNSEQEIKDSRFHVSEEANKENNIGLNKRYTVAHLGQVEEIVKAYINKLLSKPT